MKKRNCLLLWMVILFEIIGIGQLTTNASEIDMRQGETAVEQEASTEQETGMENVTEAVTETTQEPGGENHITAGEKEEDTDITKSVPDNGISDEDYPQNTAGNIGNDIEAQNMEEEDSLRIAFIIRGCNIIAAGISMNVKLPIWRNTLNILLWR